MLALAVSVAGCGAAQADEVACGSLHNAFGPFDYRTATAHNKQLVEGAHFTTQVESLRKGNTSFDPSGDIDYTLRVFPNHPRALLAMSKLALRERKPKPAGMGFTVECWFDRAFRMSPDDPMPHALFASYLVRAGRRTEAPEVLRQTEERLDPSDANLMYTLGLTYADLKQFDKAVHYAKNAYALGFPLPGLREQLRREGVWKD